MGDVKRLLADILREVDYTRAYTGIAKLDSRVLKAIENVRRDEFVPAHQRAFAYDDGPLPIGHGQTISQPFIVALMTHLLRTRREHTVLEVGTGSCYQAAVLSQLVRQVYTVEIVKALADQAKERLQRLGYDNVEVRHGDGYFGWAEHAPFDGIIVTAAAPSIPAPLIDQLKPGGRLVIPVGLPYYHQELMVVEKNSQEQISTTSILGVAFVPLTSSHDNDEESSGPGVDSRPPP